MTNKPKDCDGPRLTSTEDFSQDNLPLTSGFKYYPRRRDSILKNPELWMKGKAEVDGVYPYWRIHDKLYDMTSFMDKHPGGRFWIEATQGTDITESFESFHIGSRPEEILKKYFVKNSSIPRNSPFTFEKNGFYRTLKKKATPILTKAGKGPSSKMLLIQDSLLFAFLYFFFNAALRDSAVFAIMGGVFASIAAIASHNFFHQKDNWRMYIFDMTCLSSRDWRISHAISHHLFPNTIYDYEISIFEPALEFLPRRNKSNLYCYCVVGIFQLICVFGFYINLIIKMILTFLGEIKPRIENLIPVIQIVIMVIATGSVYRGFWLWFVLQTSANVFFLLIGITAAHHHPDIYHEGDNAIASKDWGLYQIAATRDRIEINASLFLVAVTFGNHTLHHLFPTVDHSKLPLLMPALLETCQEFGVKFEMLTTRKLFIGAIAQLANKIPNYKSSKCFT